jgi:hypothetical protein
MTDPKSDVVSLLQFALLVNSRWRPFMMSDVTVREIWDELRLPENQNILDTLMDTCVLFTNAIGTSSELDYQTLVDSYKTTIGRLHNTLSLEDENFANRCMPKNKQDILDQHPWLVWLYFLSQHGRRFLPEQEKQ